MRPREDARVRPAGPDVFQLLVQEHACLRAEMRRVLSAPRGSDERFRESRGWQRLAEAARHHMDREEAALFPECERLFGATGAVSVLRSDHATIRIRLRTSGRTKGDPTGTLEQLSVELDAHLAREERVLFPMMAALLSGTEANRLARCLHPGP